MLVRKKSCIGNLDAKRDWGRKEYVEMQWKMLQQAEPKDYVIATGRQSSVRDFINLTSEVLGWGGIQWIGSGLAEVGKRKDNGEVVVRVDSRYFRPNEVPTLLGDSSLAKKDLGWEAQITSMN